jgi:hypothetical protein
MGFIENLDWKMWGGGGGGGGGGGRGGQLPPPKKKDYKVEKSGECST